MRKIILFYKFAPITDPQAIMMWQKSLAGSLNLKGRVIISKHGINGTLGGDIEDLKSYVKQNKLYVPFKGTEYKWSLANKDDVFPRLSIKVRDEVVTFNAADEIKVDQNGVVGGGKRLKPSQLHKLVEEKGDQVVFFDGRSLYEAKVGKFKNAVTPNVRTAKDFIPLIESGVYDDLKDKPIVTYCTGGIRCEILSTVMVNRGFKEVYQLDGGIVKYGQKYADLGLWEGSLYVFDGRMAVKFSDQAKDIGQCIHCHSNTSNYENCSNVSCNDLILICEDCIQETYCPKCSLQKEEATVRNFDYRQRG
jgi:UPF0176 protein